jgi:hypothetical protein
MTPKLHVAWQDESAANTKEKQWRQSYKVTKDVQMDFPELAVIMGVTRVTPAALQNEAKQDKGGGHQEFIFQL